MKVVHYCTNFSPVSQTFIYDYATELEKHDVETHVVAHNRVNREERPFPRVHIVDSLHRWNPRRVAQRVRLLGKEAASRRSFWPEKRRGLEQVLRQIDPSVIHAHFGPDGVVVAPVARKLDIPLITHFRGYDVSRLLPSSFWEKRYEELFQVATRLIGISNHICSKIRSLGAPEEKISLLHTGIRIDRFEYDPPHRRFDGKTVRCCHVGRLVEKKAPLKLVRSFREARGLLGDEVELHLKIAGDGPLLKPLKQLIFELELEDRVSCLGRVVHDEVIKLMRRSHLHTKHCETASDGDEEGQGVTFVEASAIGLPIVSTRHNGIPDVVKDGKTGFLVPEGDVKAMGERIAHLARNPKVWKKMSNAGRSHVESNFDLSDQTDKLVGIYRQCTC